MNSSEAESQLIDVLVETPKGSRAKYEWDHERAALRLDRRLYSATVFPADYGYIAGSKGADGEALDALVLGEDPTFPGCWVMARPIGVFWITYGDDTREAKIIAVPDKDPDWDEVRDVADLPAHQRDHISHFFDVYKDLEPSRTPEPAGYEGCEAALRVIAESRP
ncbi:MAG TPA: inorganic diphosphatase [Acidimicrobiales bacterium]|jgi:inorganic pyrophosphatase